MPLSRSLSSTARPALSIANPTLRQALSNASFTTMMVLPPEISRKLAIPTGSGALIVAALAATTALVAATGLTAATALAALVSLTPKCTIRRCNMIASSSGSLARATHWEVPLVGENSSLMPLWVIYTSVLTPSLLRSRRVRY